MIPKQILITTPIFYTNGKLHIGHLYTCLLADVLARYKRKQNVEVCFLTGADQHGDKVFQAAKDNDVPITEYLKIQTEAFKKLWKDFAIEYDYFIETTNSNHIVTVQAILNKLYKAGSIYKAIYKASYCIHCEDYFTKSELKNGDLCIHCKRELKIVEEPAYFFKISELKNWLIEYWKINPNLIDPKFIETELKNSFLTDSFSDLCISRKNISWGIDLPFDKQFKTYVWFDALINYLSGIGYENGINTPFINVWSKSNDAEIVQILGKEITRFHCIYFPMLLKTLNLKQANKLICHSWIINKSEKMSKSKGNVIDCYKLKEDFCRDAIRLYLVKQIHYSHDHNFTLQEFKEFYNSVLVNNFCNLYKRVNGMLEKYYNFDLSDLKGTLINQPKYKECYELLRNKISYYHLAMKEHHFFKAVGFLIEACSILNKFIEDEKPWILCKESKSKLNEFFALMLLVLFEINDNFSIFLVDACKIIASAYNFEKPVKLNELHKLKISQLPIIYRRV